MENGTFGSARLHFEVSAAIRLDIFLLAREETLARDIRHTQESLRDSTTGTAVKRTVRG